MALFGMRLKQRDTAAIGGFHAAYIDKKTKSKKNPLGFLRTLFSGVSLAIGGMMCYVALHYIPAYMQPQKVLSMSHADTAASRLKDRNPLEKLVAPYWDAFKSKRTYLRGGQIIQAQYVLPEGASLDLHIRQCRRLWVIEVFHCQVLSVETLQITDDTLGTQAFRFKDTGFYHFQEVVTLPAGETDYRVVWSRK